MKIKKYKIGDEEKILELFEEAFNKEMSLEYWKWRYKDNPNIKENLINLAWTKEGELVSHYAISPTSMYIEGKRFDTALSMTTMTNKKYRRKGLFIELANNLFDNTFIKVVYGFPNKFSINGFKDRLNFNFSREIKILKLMDIQSKNKMNCYNDKCELIYDFDESFDELFDEALKKYKIISSRKSIELKWRFIKHPENKYKIIKYTDKDKVLGYIVFKEFYDKKMKSIDIVDILVLKDEILKELINYLIIYCKEDLIYSINTIVSDNSLTEELYNIGFQKSDVTFSLVFKELSDINDIILEHENWYITMKDLDLF